MGSSKAPEAPDYEAAAEATAKGNQDVANQQTWANRPNITTPWGSLTWDAQAGTDPSTGAPVTNWSGNIALTPQEQQALDAQMSLSNQRSQTALGMGDRAMDTYGNGMEWGNLPQGGTYVDPAQSTRDPRWDAVGQGIGTVDSGQYAGQTGFNGPTQATQGQAGGNRPDTLFGFSNSAGPLQSTFGRTQTGMQSGVQGGDLSFGAAGAGEGIQTGGLGQSQGLKQSMNDTAGGWRQTAQDAVAGMQDPYLKNARSLKETQLLNQGITQGSEAWKNAQMELGDSETRAGLQAIAAGRDEASMLFGQDLQASQFVNQAQNQGFGQNLAAGQFGNQAQAQTFGQNVTNVGLNNAAQGQQFNQGLANANLSNQVNQQEYNQNLGRAQFANSANQQGYNQALQGAQFGNDAIQGDYNRSYADAQLGNALNQQQFNQGLASGQFANDTQRNNFAMNLSGTAQNNAAQQQTFDQVRGDIAYNNDLMSRNQQNAIAAGSYNNANQAQAANIMTQQRNQPLNELNALLTGQQIQQPNFPNAPTAQRANGPDYMAATNGAYSGALDAFGVDQANTASQRQGAASLAMAAAMFYSDLRLKKDLTYLFTLPNGIRVYSYRFIGNDSLEMGVIAQEVAEIMPRAVATDDKGFLKVNYNMVLS